MAKRKSHRKKRIKSAFRGKPQFIGIKEKPPLIERFCLICNELRNFKYNKFIGHSECIICGSREARREKT